ncbi:hypothetical protein ACP275_12G109800 [Erythranthe tilingii]
MAKIMSRLLVSVFGLMVLLSFCLNVCESLDCSVVNIESLVPCGPFVAGSDNKPTRRCCSGAQAWESYSVEDVCRCYKESPSRLLFKLNPKQMNALRIECGLSDHFANIVSCLFS